MARAYSPTPGPLTFWQYVRNVLFYIHFAIATLIYGIIGLVPMALRGREGALWLSTVWLNHTIWAVRFYLGLVCEVRGTPPTHDCLIAAKHQCFWDILSISHRVPRRAFIMKREVMRVPIIGAYAYKVGCIPIDRSRGKDAMALITDQVTQRVQDGALGQLIIYPEGTRTLPGQRKPYKHGVATIRNATRLDVVPVAVNTGLFWPRKGWGIRPGRAVIEFMPAIGPDFPDDQMLSHLEEIVEARSRELMLEAGFDAGQGASR